MQKDSIDKRADVLLAEIAQYLKDEDYNLVIEKLGELISHKVYDAEAMYAGAYSYFMLGDYGRAADWVNNTLSYNPEHLKVRVLLGRLCLLHERVDDAIAVYEYVLEHGGNMLDADILEEIARVGEGYAGQKARSIDADYPAIAKLIGNNAGTGKKKMGENDIDDTQEMKIDADNLCHKVMTANRSLADKVKMLNTFAGGFYLNGQLHEAETLLLAALEIDNTSEATLRNMVMVQIGLGCKEKAERIVSEMSVPDFALLKIIQSC